MTEERFSFLLVVLWCAILALAVWLFGCSAIPQRVADAVANDVIDHSRPLEAVKKRMDGLERRIDTIEALEHGDMDDIRENRKSFREALGALDERVRLLENGGGRDINSAPPAPAKKRRRFLE